MKKIFTRKIMHWHSKENKRIMPWKGEKDPYRIWISEIILQQTRVTQGLAYYNNFIQEFPSLQSLAVAREEVVFKVWEGLGYYSRCRNLIFTARYILNKLDGVFPETYDEVLALKGIGPYTAAAISSFAYGLPHAVVDGNVFRVLARYFGEARAVDSTNGRKYFNELANQLLYKKDSASYNQGIMDFGATVCKPQSPLCQQCVLQQHCVAYNQQLVNRLPVKEKELKKRKRWFTYFIFLVGDDKVLINKRLAKDIWRNLSEFYLHENLQEPDWNPEQIEKCLRDQLGIEKFKVNRVSRLYKQQLTHQNLQGRFITIGLNKIPASLSDYTAVNTTALKLVAFPKFINQYLQEHKLFNDGDNTLTI
jgi:A/G-specific adenine glycosylase